MQMGIVSIQKTDGGVTSALSRGLADIGGLSSIFTEDDKVLIKPNLNDDVCYTNKDLVESFVLALREIGVRSIMIGESTFGNTTMTDRLFEATGYAKLAEKLSVPLVNFNGSQPVRIPVLDHKATDHVTIAAEAANAVKIINIPVMKVHYATSVSLGLKNLKGFLVGREKRRFHEIGLDPAIVDLGRTVRTDLTIIDCIDCMETMGPKGGDIKKLGAIIIGRNAGETDIAGLNVMGFEISEVPHIRDFCRIEGIDERSIRYRGIPWEEIASPFKRAELGLALLAGYEVHNKDACSSCVNALILSLRFLEAKNTPIALFLGSKHKHEASSKGFARIRFGNCCSLKDADIAVSGCPPYPFELNEKLKEYLAHNPN
jgi:uncharacterized protein (DUF362 family)